MIRIPFVTARHLLLYALVILPLCFPNAARAQFTLADKGIAKCVIVLQAGATEGEHHAAEDLAATLHVITGADFPVRPSLPADGPAIIVGPGPDARKAFPDIDLAKFQGEEIVEKTKGHLLLLAGGRPRGSIYAVDRFLQDQCGVRWWAPWASDIPRQKTLRVAALDIREEPAFEYREPFWFPALDGGWAAHNASNGNGENLTADLGGKIAYEGGFVHTAYGLVPPSENFGSHPEWYSLIDGKRTVDNAQLCLTNTALRDYVVERVRAILRKSPDARIISISQNDDVRYCQCENCAALDAREGSHAGTMIDFVNYVADKLGPEFPNVAFDTLAYQYTRHPPKTIRPHPNVIVRLCSIECNFGEPFDHPSNAAFYQDLTDWSKICDRLYVWDYTTDFGGYIQPHPNWFTLGANVRIFQANHVKGVFSEGAYQSNGGEMSEMRAWVLARLMWNPALDDRKLIVEFLNGYYGKAAAPFILQYLDLVHGAAKGYYLSCGAPIDTPYLDFKTMAQAETLWRQAENAVSRDPAKLWRVREGHLPVRYVFLSRWLPLRAEAKRTGAACPLPDSRKTVADEWRAVALGAGPAGWSPVTHVREGEATVEAFLARNDHDPEPPNPPVRLPNPRPPADLPTGTLTGAVDIQDDAANLFQEGELSEFRADPKASDGGAVRMPGFHHEWAFQVQFANFPKAAQDAVRKWKAYVEVRVQPRKGLTSAEGALRGDRAAFTAGVWNTQTGGMRASIGIACRAALASGVSDEYRSYLLGDLNFKPGDYIWVAPTANPDVEAVWVDRVYLVPDSSSPPAAVSTPALKAEPGVDSLSGVYHDMLLDYRRYAEARWTHPENLAGMGYWGTGRADWNNEGTRAQANTALVYALLLRNGDRAFVVADRVEPALRYACAIHNTGDRKATDGKTWGDSWQSAMWAANLGVAAWLVRDQLQPETLSAVERVVAHEADRYIAAAPPSMEPGDTKAEENAWDLTAPAAALLLMPNNSHAKDWNEAVLRYGFNTLSVAQDKNDATIADGRPVKDWVTTEQIHPDYTLENHGIFHPVYAMVSPATMAQAAISYRLGGRQIPEALRHNVLREWGMLREIVLPDGEWLYPQGLDWDLHDYEHIHYWAMLATLYKEPAAAVLERRLTGYACRRQRINGDGSFVGPSGGLGFAREAVQAERVAFSLLMHEQFGPPPLAADPAAPDAAWLEMEKTLAPVSVFDAAGFALYRAERGIFSLSWKNRLMGVVAPNSENYLHSPYVTTPNAESLIGRFRIAGQSIADSGKWTVIGQTVTAIGDGFAAAVNATVNNGRLHQQIAVAGIAPGALAYLDRVTATTDVTITEERGVPVSIENDEVSGGVRRIFTAIKGDPLTVIGGIVGDHPLLGNWVNIDGRLGLAMAAGSRLLYRSAGKPNRSGAREDFLYGFFNGSPRTFNAGDVVAERAGLLLPNSSLEETARLAASLSVTRDRGGVTLRYDGPDGRRHTLTMGKDGSVRADGGKILTTAAVNSRL